MDAKADEEKGHQDQEHAVMGQRFTQHDGTNVLADVPGVGVMLAHSTGAPADLVTGFAKGGIWMDTTNGRAYVNSGTLSSSTWRLAGLSDETILYPGDSLQDAYDALPSYGGTIYLGYSSVIPNPGFDVGDGLNLNRNKPAVFIGSPRYRRQRNGIGTDKLSGTSMPYLYSSTGAQELINTDAKTAGGLVNAYGFHFENLWFYLDDASQLYAIRAPNCCDAKVFNCGFWNDTAATGIIAIYSHKESANGDDASWWRIQDCSFSNMAICKFGKNGVVNSENQSNQHVIMGNVAFGGPDRDSTVPCIEFNYVHRSVVAFNNIEHYEDGILIRESSTGNMTFGNGGEDVTTYITDDTAFMNLHIDTGNVLSTASSEVLFKMDGTSANNFGISAFTGSYGALGGGYEDGNAFINNSTRNNFSLINSTQPTDEAVNLSSLGIESGAQVTQTGSLTSGVTCSESSGQITTVSSTLAAGAEAAFTVTNTVVEAEDTAIVNVASTSSAGTPMAFCSAMADGSFDITLTNLHASAAMDNTMVINFVVVKGGTTTS